VSDISVSAELLLTGSPPGALSPARAAEEATPLLLGTAQLATLGAALARFLGVRAELVAVALLGGAGPAAVRVTVTGAGATVARATTTALALASADLAAAAAAALPGAGVRFAPAPAPPSAAVSIAASAGITSQGGSLASAEQELAAALSPAAVNAVLARFGAPPTARPIAVLSASNPPPSPSPRPSPPPPPPLSVSVSANLTVLVADGSGLSASAVAAVLRALSSQPFQAPEGATGVSFSVADIAVSADLSVSGLPALPAAQMAALSASLGSSLSASPGQQQPTVLATQAPSGPAQATLSVVVQGSGANADDAAARARALASPALLGAARAAVNRGLPSPLVTWIEALAPPSAALLVQATVGLSSPGALFAAQSRLAELLASPALDAGLAALGVPPVDATPVTSVSLAAAQPPPPPSPPPPPLSAVVSLRLSVPFRPASSLTAAVVDATVSAFRSRLNTTAVSALAGASVSFSLAGILVATTLSVPGVPHPTAPQLDALALSVAVSLGVDPAMDVRVRVASAPGAAALEVELRVSAGAVFSSRALAMAAALVSQQTLADALTAAAMPAGASGAFSAGPPAALVAVDAQVGVASAAPLAEVGAALSRALRAEAVDAALAAVGAPPMGAERAEAKAEAVSSVQPPPPSQPPPLPPPPPPLAVIVSANVSVGFSAGVSLTSAAVSSALAALASQSASIGALGGTTGVAFSVLDIEVSGSLVASGIVALTQVQLGALQGGLSTALGVDKGRVRARGTTSPACRRLDRTARPSPPPRCCLRRFRSAAARSRAIAGVGRAREDVALRPHGDAAGGHRRQRPRRRRRRGAGPRSLVSPRSSGLPLRPRRRRRRRLLRGRRQPTAVR
jgi:hypothetical protein